MVTEASARGGRKVKCTCIRSHVKVKLIAIITTLADVFDRLTIVHLCFITGTQLVFFGDDAFYAMIVWYILTGRFKMYGTVDCAEAVRKRKGWYVECVRVSTRIEV